MTKDERKFLDEVLDDNGQKRKYEKCERVGEKFHYLQATNLGTKTM